MRILIAPDKFKGSLTAAEAAEAMRKGVLKVFPEADCRLFPMADGGEGFFDILSRYLPVENRRISATDPLGRSIEANYGWVAHSRMAIIELSGTAGLQLLRKEEYDPWLSSTSGTGLIIRAAVASGAATILLGLGGSATTDAGTGILQALGFRFLDQERRELNACGASLQQIRKIIPPDQLPDIRFIIAADVDNPLYGPSGAATVFAPQKGAAAEVVLLLDKGLQNYATVLKEQTGLDIATIPGTGAAGGIAASLIPFFKVDIRSGAALLMQYSKLTDVLDEADLIITGEGQLDHQTLKGKVVARLAAAGAERKIPVIVVCGKLNEPELKERLQLKAILSLQQDAVTEAEAMAQAASRIESAIATYFSAVQQ